MANARMKCPLENNSTSPGTARNRLTTRSSRAPICRGDSPGTTIAEQLPIGALFENVGGGSAFVLAVVPFDELRNHFGHSAEASQLAGSQRALQRAGKHLRENQFFESIAQTAGIALAILGQRQIGQSGMLATDAPRGFAVASQIGAGQLRAQTKRLQRPMRLGRA